MYIRYSGPCFKCPSADLVFAVHHFVPLQRILDAFGSVISTTWYGGLIKTNLLPVGNVSCPARPFCFSWRPDCSPNSFRVSLSPAGSYWLISVGYLVLNSCLFFMVSNFVNCAFRFSLSAYWTNFFL